MEAGTVHMCALIPALRWRQEEQEFKVTLSYTGKEKKKKKEALGLRILLNRASI